MTAIPIWLIAFLANLTIGIFVLASADRKDKVGDWLDKDMTGIMTIIFTTLWPFTYILVRKANK